MAKGNGSATAVGEQQSNDARQTVESGMPYRARVTIEGIAAMLCHRWSNEAVAEKAASAKGSKAKKSDDVDSYVYRDNKGYICIPGEYVRASLCGKKGAAKLRQDPRSPRKSALDLYSAGIIVETELAPITKVSGQVAETWDYLDARRVTIQMSGITRVRPAFLAGWRATFDISVILPQYIPPVELRAILADAGRFVGLGDFRPTYGRFDCVTFEVIHHA